MLKLARSTPWTCARCLQTQARRASTIAAAKTTANFSPPAFNTQNPSQDDKTLRQVFDSRPFWQEFSKHSRNASTSASVGLIRNRHLTTPDGFMVYAGETMRKCSALVHKILAINTVEGYRSVVQDMDRLSDLMCRVIDLSDFIRSTHPNGRFQVAATNAYSAMYEYMNQLNTTTGLNDQLKKASSIPEVYNSWTEEERRVANILIKDFSKSAIDLTEDDRKQFVTISNDIAKIGQEFIDYMAPRRSYVRFATGRLNGLSPEFVNSVSRLGTAIIPATGHEAVTALTHADDSEVRRDIYIANRTAAKSSIARLEEMLLSRSRLAKLTGYETYAHMALSDKMAKSPDAVYQFLSALQSDTQPLVQAELRELQNLKNSHVSRDVSSRIYAWDKDYYIHRLTQQMQNGIRSSSSLSSFFSLGTVFQGLSRIFTRLCGIRFVARETLPGETWHEDVRRLDVMDENGRNVAVVYCDLYARSGKHSNPCHFTLRCSRAILPEELSEASTEDGPFADVMSAATDGSAYSVDHETSTVYQLPTIALICSFNQPTSGPSSDSPALLSLRQVQTLFHEMGHALHSILGRTRLQNVSGTRCPTDLAELPSILMEYFALEPSAIALWARHWASDHPLPYELVEEQLQVRNQMQGLDIEGQIMMSKLDQALHAQDWHNDNMPLDSTTVYHSISSQTSLPDPPETAWQGFFGHLFCYGGMYYSYLFARALAGRVWHSVFEDGRRACDRRAGERLDRELLRWGGSKGAWQCVAGLLQEDRLADGDETSMAMVGKWGVKSQGNHFAM